MRRAASGRRAGVGVVKLSLLLAEHSAVAAFSLRAARLAGSSGQPCCFSSRRSAHGGERRTRFYFMALSQVTASHAQVSLHDESHCCIFVAWLHIAGIPSASSAFSGQAGRAGPSPGQQAAQLPCGDQLGTGWFWQPQQKASLSPCILVMQTAFCVNGCWLVCGWVNAQREAFM